MLGSGSRSTAPGSAAVNDGQPVPKSYLAPDANSGAPQPAQLRAHSDHTCAHTHARCSRTRPTALQNRNSGHKHGKGELL
jgi:hypothetical protein